MAKNVLIVYGSQYGYTEKYAVWISEKIQDLPQKPTVTVKPSGDLTSSDIASAQVVVIGTSDYGGFLTGASEITKFSSELQEKSRAFFTVSFSGLDGMPVEKLDAVVTKNFGDLATDSPIFHFRGGLDHKRLSFKHKTVMVGIRAGIAAMPHKNKANQQMLDSFDQGTVDYSDENSTEPLVEKISQLL